VDEVRAGLGLRQCLRDVNDDATAPPVDSPTDATDDTSAGDQAESRRSANAEAVRYRTQLRATEGERDQLRERLGWLNGREVERLVTLAWPTAPTSPGTASSSTSCSTTTVTRR
jgi:hypothetical protein